MEKTDDPIIFVLQIGTLSQAIKQNTFKKLLRVIKSSKFFVKKEQVHLQKEVYILITLFVTLIPSILQKGNLSKEKKEGFLSSPYRERYGFKRLKFYVWYASKVLDYKLAKSIFFFKPFLFHFWSDRRPFYSWS